MIEALNEGFNQEASYETRELAEELKAPRPDRKRVSFFLDEGADLKEAMTLANCKLEDVTRDPDLRHLKLERLFGASHKI